MRRAPFYKTENLLRVFITEGGGANWIVDQELQVEQAGSQAALGGLAAILVVFLKIMVRIL